MRSIFWTFAVDVKLIAELNLEAPLNIYDIFKTFVVSRLTGKLNAPAAPNMIEVSVTPCVFENTRGWFNRIANKNIEAKLVTLVRSQIKEELKIWQFANISTRVALAKNTG